MFCKNCGTAMNDNQDFCTNCGAKKGNGDKFCANCGQPIAPNADICLNCGMSVKKNYLNGHDKVSMAVLCFFLGGLGIHNFVMGENKKGIFKIIMSLCFGIGAILALIDFIKILIDSYEVNPDKLI